MCAVVCVCWGWGEGQAFIFGDYPPKETNKNYSTLNLWLPPITWDPWWMNHLVYLLEGYPRLKSWHDGWQRPYIMPRLSCQFYEMLTMCTICRQSLFCFSVTKKLLQVESRMSWNKRRSPPQKYSWPSEGWLHWSPERQRPHRQQSSHLQNR